MKNNLGWTTIEQAKQLVMYGLSVRTHDMHWEEDPLKNITTLKNEHNFAIDWYSLGYREGYFVPCWSLGRLIEIAESYQGAKVSYDDHCWLIKQGGIHCIGESLPDVMVEFLKRRKEKE